jgi:hypothetical protein
MRKRNTQCRNINALSVKKRKRLKMGFTSATLALRLIYLPTKISSVGSVVKTIMEK